MPISWREGIKGRYAVIVYSDPYTLGEFACAMAGVFAHPVSQPTVRLLIDRRYCSAPTTLFVRRLVEFAELNPERLTDARIAAVASHDVTFGMGRMLETLVEVHRLPYTLRTFREWDDAERWLVESARAEPSRLDEC